MSPTLTQRLGLRPVRLDKAGRRQLFAARAGAALCAGEAVLVLVAAAAGDRLGAAAPSLLVSSVLALGLAAVLLCAYERLDSLGTNAVALVGNAAITILVATPALGAPYRVVYVWLLLYIAFFMSRRHAILQIGAIALSSGGALVVTLPLGRAFELWLLSTGILAGVTATSMLIRARLERAVAAARRTSATLDAFFLHASTGFAFLDRDLRHVRVNEPLAEMLEIPAERLVGRTIGEIAPHLAGALEPLLHGVLETGKPLENLELESPDGKRQYLVSYYAVTAPDGTQGLGETVVEVTHLKDVERMLEETNRKLTVLATTDELTGLPNRRLLGEQLDLALARARRGGLAVALLCFDLDRFKEVNDTLGHGYGDEFLVEVAGRLRSGARETDVVARVGGDEFVILLADLDVQEAPELSRAVADRVSSLLAEPLTIGAVELRAEASIGIAVYPLDSRDAKGLLAAADAAMYVGKNALTRVA